MEVTAPPAALLVLQTPYIWHIVLEFQFEQLLIQSRQESLELLQAELARLIRPKEGDQEAAGGAMQAADAAVQAGECVSGEHCSDMGKVRHGAQRGH